MANFSQIKINLLIKIKKSVALTFSLFILVVISSHSKMKKGENKLSKHLKYQSATLRAGIAKKRN